MSDAQAAIELVNTAWGEAEMQAAETRGHIDGVEVRTLRPLPLPSDWEVTVAHFAELVNPITIERLAFKAVRDNTIPFDRKWDHFAGWCWGAADAAREGTQ